MPLNSPAVAGNGDYHGQPPAVCRDCEAPVTGHYCAQCGQETRIETPSVREFLREFLQDQIALEGKLLRTLRVLILAPGQLTLDFIGGVRQRYIRPLRLYLTLSVIFFALLGFGEGRSGTADDDAKAPVAQVKPAARAKVDADADDGDKDKDSASGGNTAPATPEPPADKDAATAKTSRDLTLDDLHGIKTGWAPIDSRIGGLLARPSHLKQSLSDAMQNEAPIAMFFLLPLFAAMLKVAYLGRGLRYGVHVLFALHFHAFVFLDFALNRLPWPGIVAKGLDVWLFAYLVLALRRVYGGGAVGTSFGALFLSGVYAILILSVLFTVGLISLLFTS